MNYPSIERLTDYGGFKPGYGMQKPEYTFKIIHGTDLYNSTDMYKPR